MQYFQCRFGTLFSIHPRKFLLAFFVVHFSCFNAIGHAYKAPEIDNLKAFKRNRTEKLVDNAVITHPRIPMMLTMMFMGRRPHRSMIPGVMKLPINIAILTRDAAI